MPGATDRRLNLWRAISNELNTLSTIQQETLKTTRTAINENSMSGVLAVYDADGNRVLQDFIFNTTDPDGTVDSKIRDIESLKSAYEKNKKKLIGIGDCHISNDSGDCMSVINRR